MFKVVMKFPGDSYTVNSGLLLWCLGPSPFCPWGFLFFVNLTMQVTRLFSVFQHNFMVFNNGRFGGLPSML